MQLNNTYFLFLIFVVCSCSQPNNNTTYNSRQRLDVDTLEQTDTLKKNNYLPLPFFSSEILDNDFLLYHRQLIEALEKCDSVQVMSFLNDYITVGQYGCDVYQGMDTLKLYINKGGFWGCRRDLAVANLISNQRFPHFCELLLKEITRYGIQKFSTKENDFYGKVEGYKNYNFIESKEDSLFYDYNLLIVEAESNALYSAPSKHSKVLNGASQFVTKVYTGAGATIENKEETSFWFKIPNPDLTSPSLDSVYVNERNCHYNDKALRITFRKINRAWKITALYQTPGC